MQRSVASTKSRTCCFPGGSDFTTQNGAARNVKGLLHHRCSSQQWPVVPLLFVGCKPAMHSLLCAAACFSLSSGGISVGRSISTGAGATCVFVALTDWANPALRLRVPRYVNAHVLPLHLILGFHVLFSHVCGGRRESFETQVFPLTVIDSAICFEMHRCRTQFGARGRGIRMMWLLPGSACSVNEA